MSVGSCEWIKVIVIDILGFIKEIDSVAGYRF
jgi:hypothetical protein